MYLNILYWDTPNIDGLIDTEVNCLISDIRARDLYIKNHVIHARCVGLNVLNMLCSYIP